MTERAKLAQDFHDQGYNCAQAVACAYCDLVGLDKETAYKMSEGADKPGTTKGQTYKVTKMLKEKFEQKNGAYLCRDLKGVADGNVRRSCPGCIEDACALIEEYLTK